MTNETMTQSGQTAAQSGRVENQTEDLMQTESVESVTPAVADARTPEEYAADLRETAREARRVRQKNAELRQQLKSLEDQKLAEQGKWRELAESEKSAREAVEKKLNDLEVRIARTTVEKQVGQIATELGCVDTEAFFSLAPLEDLNIDDNYNVDVDEVKNLCAMVKKKRWYLFPDKKPPMSDGVPSQGIASGKPVSQMSKDEILKQLGVKPKRFGG